MTIAIFGNSGKRETLSEVKYLLDFMQRHDVRVILSNELRSEMNLREEYPLYTPETDENIHFALSIGGDGTFLTTAMQVAEKGIPILGINCGHLGFLADVQTEEVEPIMLKLISGDFTIEERSMLEVTTSDDAAKRILNPFALNEVAILKQELASMISVETILHAGPLPDGENSELLHNYYGDGLIISTPTGSTAYNLSAGGPIAVPQSRVLLLSPVASHSLNVRPLVIPDDWKLDLRVHSRTGAFLISIDGRSQRLTEEVTLHVEKAAFSVKLVRIDGHSFINALKTKLSWGI